MLCGSRHRHCCGAGFGATQCCTKPSGDFLVGISELGLGSGMGCIYIKGFDQFSNIKCWAHLLPVCVCPSFDTACTPCKGQKSGMLSPALVVCISFTEMYDDHQDILANEDAALDGLGVFGMQTKQIFSEIGKFDQLVMQTIVFLCCYSTVKLRSGKSVQY